MSVKSEQTTPRQPSNLGIVTSFEYRLHFEQYITEQTRDYPSVLPLFMLEGSQITFMWGT
ncbi:hypothetical protein MYX75_11365 [Acidobacteria bacterium AH-259-A15]|nr:hypothetical protein [Acidobacteria bacterium AH-259-A15]